MKERLNVNKSIGTGEPADDTEGESGSCRSVCGSVPVCHGGSFYAFLSYLNRFVYGFCVIWNSNSSRVWL